ncbi:transcriptional regulator family: Fungal Specific TF [Penicillium argentinense]|uniref:Transcriptional regulator family: Fungal Specific TF n=1 Tax=Penicillium argentinense TaxID=1131581 RepID=A0A9W9KKX1_9EURO|nr:transcriptional regulator family: Fungal Specific TF [Penicillium argentinense]KAJ5110534.1 transcriptional regulator family: Fungal Specific TF [Penicillium argentinense]
MPPTKVACRVCHDRRVKCDRRDGAACSNCRNAQVECEAIVSRRGRRRKLPLLPSVSVSNSNSLPIAFEASSRRAIAPNFPIDSDAQHDRNTQQEPCFPTRSPSGKTPYVGDSSNLNYLIQQFGNPFKGTTDARPLQDRLQSAMLTRLGQSTAQEIKQINTSTMNRLKVDGAFDLPSQETSAALLDAYFNYSLAAIPILDKERFLTSVQEGSFSHLLLNAVYLAATCYCSDNVIANAGFVSRYAASLSFYRKAKALYDAGYESDAITTIQATFFICHWWSGLLEHKDPWYWLGISVGIALALGMHQERSYLRLDERDRRLWRRIWWMVYAMDIHLSMLLDRPPRVQGRLCNVPPLSEADVERVSESQLKTSAVTSIDEDLFMIYAVQLASIVDQFFTIKSDEHGQSQDICLEQISLWSSSLPPEFKSLSTNSSTWAILTQILYQEYRLVLHRSNPRFSQETGPGTPTFAICTEISHMLEIIMANNMVYAAAASMYAPLSASHLPGPFLMMSPDRIAPTLSVLAIHIVNIHRGDAGVRMISEHRARFCMAILDKLQDRLPVVAAFYPIYEALLKQFSTAGDTCENTDASDQRETEQTVEGGSLRNDEPGGSLNTVPADGSLERVLQENMNGTFPFSFPFGNLFEEIFLGSDEQLWQAREDDAL